MKSHNWERALLPSAATLQDTIECLNVSSLQIAMFVTDENMRSTRACESIVDSPGGHLNPLVVVSEVHAGCSHLLHATGQALLRRQEGEV